MAEIISIHIMKTAGVSFHVALQRVYGKVISAYQYLDEPGMRPERDDLLYIDFPERKRLWDIAMDRVGPDVQILADHAPVQLYDGLFSEARRVTWLRDPVARVISNFIHARHYAHLSPTWEQYTKSIYQFINYERERNVMSFFTAGGDMGHFFFVGITEHFQRDIARLAGMLGWPEGYPVVYRNKVKNPELKMMLLADKDVVAEIERLNQWDIELYHRALER